jgi:LysM repeat protein
MSKPVPGTKYTIVKNDTLWDIAAAAYGTGRKYTVIWEANKSSLRSGDPNLIYPGEVLWIPNDTEMDAARAELPRAAPVSNTDHGSMVVKINDKEFAVESGNVLRTFDTAADGFTATMRFDPEDPDHLAAFKPFQYQPCECYLGGKLQVKGLLYTHDLGLITTRSAVTVHGWSPTVDLVDCVAEPPFQEKNVTLENRIRNLIAPYGIALEFNVD